MITLLPEVGLALTVSTLSSIVKGLGGSSDRGESLRVRDETTLLHHWRQREGLGLMVTKLRSAIRLGGFLAVAAVVFAPVAARADFTGVYSADEIAAAPYTFDALPVGFVSEATNALTSAEGFTFPDAVYGVGSGEYIASTSEGGHVLDVFGGTLGFDGLVRFEFVDVVEAAGVEYDTATPLTLLAYDDAGNLINTEGSVTVPGGAAGFLGIASNIGIREIVIHDSAGTFQVDNLRFGALAVPVPSAWMLGAIGLGLVGWVRRRA